VTPYGDKLVKVSKDKQGKFKIDKLMAVRYGDLIVPSEAETKEALRQIEREKATTIIVPDSTYLEEFGSLVNNAKLSDITFVVEGKPIRAHKTILAARSQHFEAMFFHGLRESHESEVALPDVQYDIFLDCLRYIYTDKLIIKNPDHAIEIIGAANYFKLDRLKAICENIIRNSIDTENAAYILQIASRYEAWQLKSLAMNFIMLHYDEVSNTKCFEDLDKPVLLEVMREACKQVQFDTNKK